MGFITDIHTHKHIYQWNNTKWVKIQLFIFMSKVNLGTLPSTQNTFSVLLDSVCAQFVPSRPWSQIATNRKLRRQGFLNCRNLWLLQFVTVQNTTSQIYINSTPGYTPKYRKHVYILIGRFQECFLFASFMDLITDIPKNRYTIQKTPKLAKMQFFIFMSKVNLGTLSSTQNAFSGLLKSICHIKDLITNCDKSQIATAGIPELWQFVTVAICDGSKHNFSDRLHSNRGYTP